MIHASNDTDEELLRRMIGDDEQAFLEIYQRYASKTRALAYGKINCRETSREIVQELFAKLWERRRSLRIASLQNYLAVAVKYQCMNHWRRKLDQNRHQEEYFTRSKGSEESTYEWLNHKSLSDALEKGLASLPQKTKTVFQMSRFEGKSISEIAAKLNLSEQAIKYHITQSLKELRVYLKDFLIVLAFLCMG